MTLPVTPPQDPMLALLQEDIPRGDGWLYEPKWDGFRAIVFKDGDWVHIASRDHKPLERYFPELVPALQSTLPDCCVVDGEVTVTGPDGLDFDALLQRIHPAPSRIKRLAAETPSSYVAFDLLAIDDEDIRSAPFEDRRRRLVIALGAGSAGPQKEGAGSAGPQMEGAGSPRPEEQGVVAVSVPDRERGTQILVTPQSRDPSEAMVWLDTLEAIGLDGIVAKQAQTTYVHGERVMVKVKRQRTADCVVGGYRLSKSKDGLGSLLLGLYDDEGVLHYVGHTSSFKARERRELLEHLRPLEGGESFGAGRTPGAPSRWSAAREKTWVPLEPRLVCEVSFDKLQGDRFRHASTFKRWRDDKSPRDCTLDQVFPKKRKRAT